MQEIVLDEEFQFLLPMLDEETFRLLEENVLEHGCREPLVLWNGILIDGYNRYKICSRHNIPFNIVEKEFASREEVIIWIISNQISRRNLTPIQLSYFRGLHYKADKKQHGSSDRFLENDPSAQNEPLQSGSTASRLAQAYRVSRETIKRNAKLAETLIAIGEVSPDVKRKILAGEVQIGKNRLEAMALASKDELRAVVKEIEAGEFVSRTPRNSGLTKVDTTSSETVLPEIQKLNVIISDFAKNFNSMLQQYSDGNPLELKAVLRTYIDELENLYKNIR